MTLDLENPTAAVWEEPTREDLLGPTLRVKGQIMSRAPMFSTSEANNRTLPAETQSFLLLPFANQDAFRGPCQIFNDYRVPSEVD